jgi:hypothetical protein
MTVRLHKKIDTPLERARLARAVIAQADAGGDRPIARGSGVASSSAAFGEGVKTESRYASAGITRQSRG